MPVKGVDLFSTKPGECNNYNSIIKLLWNAKSFLIWKQNINWQPILIISGVSLLMVVYGHFNRKSYLFFGCLRPYAWLFLTAPPIAVDRQLLMTQYGTVRQDVHRYHQLWCDVGCRVCRLVLINVVAMRLSINLKNIANDLYREWEYYNYLFYVLVQLEKDEGSKFSNRIDGYGLSIAHFPSKTAFRRLRLSWMSQAMSQPQANGSEFNYTNLGAY